MGAPDLLQNLRNAGLVLTLTAGDKLHVAPREALTDDYRASIRSERDALVLALRAERHGTCISGNRLLTLEQGDACHAGGWDDGEIAAFTAREITFARMGRHDAEHLAERLTLRDREGDDRRMCLECSWMGVRGQCIAAASGRIPGADRQLEPVHTILQRCAAFGLHKGLV